MSRTVRRKKTRKFNSNFESDWIYESKMIFVQSKNGFHYFFLPKAKLEGKEFDKAYYKYHRCTSHPWVEGKYAEAYAERRYRMIMKTQLRKWFKDHEYEIQEYPKRDCSWDD